MSFANMHGGYPYVQGYTNALQDVIRTIESTDVDFKRNKLKRTKKEYMAMLNCMLENRAILRENPDAFVRYNCKDGKWEIYIMGVGVYNG